MEELEGRPVGSSCVVVPRSARYAERPMTRKLPEPEGARIEELLSSLSQYASKGRPTESSGSARGRVRHFGGSRAHLQGHGWRWCRLSCSQNCQVTVQLHPQRHAQVVDCCQEFTCTSEVRHVTITLIPGGIGPLSEHIGEGGSAKAAPPARPLTGPVRSPAAQRAFALPAEWPGTCRGSGIVDPEHAGHRIVASARPGAARLAIRRAARPSTRCDIQRVTGLSRTPTNTSTPSSLACWAWVESSG